MKGLITQGLVIALLALTTQVTPSWADDTYKLDVRNSAIQFMGAKPDGQHTGGFTRFNAAMTTKGEFITGFAVRIDATSITSDDPKLTEHLKTPDFFDVKQFPEASFQTTQMDEQHMTGNLTIHGVKQQITVPIKISGSRDAVQVETQFKIDRTKFGINYGAGKIHNEVPIMVKMTFVK